MAVGKFKVQMAMGNVPKIKEQAYPHHRPTLSSFEYTHTYMHTPSLVTQSEDGEERVVVGSIAELEELTGAKVTDIHRHFIDHLTIPSRQGKGLLRRVDDVFDCWFESGSMPYAQV